MKHTPRVKETRPDLPVRNPEQELSPPAFAGEPEATDSDLDEEESRNELGLPVRQRPRFEGTESPPGEPDRMRRSPDPLEDEG